MTKHTDEAAQAADENLLIEITPEMLEAGTNELLESFSLNGDWADLVHRVFIAMVYASPRPSRLVWPHRREPLSPPSGHQD